MVLNQMCLFHLLGMGVSSFAIIFMKLKLEWHSIIFTSLGGIAGIIFGEMNFFKGFHPRGMVF